uniref:Alpha-macroglobulin receptor-binding domain-containing protein n=1 Tax=Myripristis murdjan TaxID=586833 RepID=A0A667YQD2_9TELE
MLFLFFLILLLILVIFLHTDVVRCYMNVCFCGYRHYMVAIPAVLEAGADTQFCASLLQPNETLLMTITLTSQAENRTLLTEKADTDLHTCVKFKVPMVQNQEVRNLEVEVHGKTFHSKEIRKVMIRAYSPMTFIQTDKPIYLPGQTGKCMFYFSLSSCIMVTVTPAPSVEYTLTPLSGDKYSSCLCANERKTVSWTMAPSVLGAVNVSVSAEAVTSDVSCNNEIVSVPERGRIDVVTRSLIVKPEGTEVTKAYNWLLCPNGQYGLDQALNAIMSHCFSAGDILGRALSNLNGLLRMPYGCGEQNMALLAPNIYILEYLTNTNQMTKAIKEKATGFLTSGYQRQLNYKHQDGAYSTFGSGSGNTWLTAFVLKSFVKAKTFVYIDPEVIDHSKTWLEGKQQANGCFQQLGKLFNNRMKGGVNDEVTLSAYVTAALLEANMSVSVKSFSSLSNTYTRALLAYVFTLAGDMKTRALLLEQLDKDAVRQGGFIFWTQKATETQTSDSLSVEISAYVLLAKLSASSTSREELGSASGIVRWLASQQNSYGGFSSTQDTVVALQALALYSSQVFTPEGSSSVLAQSPSGHLTFEVDPDNKLLYQEKQLKDVAGKYQFEVKGTACVAVQVSGAAQFFHSWRKLSSTAYNPTLLWFFHRYRGKESTTNMVILDIKVLSGFVPNPASLNNVNPQLNIMSLQLKRALLVDRVEQEKDHILIYLKELLPGIPINHNLELVQELPMQNLKAAVVKIYDYYQQRSSRSNFPESCKAIFWEHWIVDMYWLV